jgi:hypothetical protein
MDIFRVERGTRKGFTIHTLNPRAGTPSPPLLPLRPFILMALTSAALTISPGLFQQTFYSESKERAQGDGLDSN